MAKLGVQIVGDSASLKSALGSSLAAANTWATGTEGAAVRVTEAFKGVSTAQLQLAVAQDKLGISMARYDAGSTGAAAATLRYRQQVESLGTAQSAAAEKQLAAQRAIGRGLTTYVSLPVLAIAAESLKMGMDFQKSMLLIQTQAGAGAAEVKNLSTQVLELSHSTTQGPVALSQGLFHLESLGLRGAAAMGVLKTSSNAAFLGIANLEDVTTALGGAVVTGIKGTRDYNQAMGTLNATVGAGNMHMQDLTDALGTGLLSKAKNAGVSLAEVGAALAVLTDRGIPAQKAATQLGTTFALMQAPSKSAQKALADMGIGSTQLRDELAKPNGLMMVLHTLAAGMDKVGKRQGSSDILSAFGRSKQSGAILTLVQSLSDPLSNYGGKLAQIQQQSSNFSKDVTASQTTAAYKVGVAWSSIRADMTQLGGVLLPFAADFAKGADGIAATFEKLPGPVKRDLGVLAGLLAVGGPLILGTLAVSRAVKTIGTAFGFLPAAAASGIAATEAEVATIGVAAAGAETQVLGLRGALLGLGGGAVAAGLAGLSTKLLGLTKLLSRFGAEAPALADALKILEGKNPFDTGQSKSGLTAAAQSLVYGKNGQFSDKLFGMTGKDASRADDMLAQRYGYKTPYDAIKAYGSKGGLSRAQFEAFTRDLFKQDPALAKEALGHGETKSDFMTAAQLAVARAKAKAAESKITGGEGQHGALRGRDTGPSGPKTKQPPPAITQFSTSTLPYKVRLELAQAVTPSQQKKADQDAVAAIQKMISSGRLSGPLSKQAFLDAQTMKSGLLQQLAGFAKKAATQSAKLPPDTKLAQARLDLERGDTAAAKTLLMQDRLRLEEELKQAKTAAERVAITRQLTTVERLLKSKAASFALPLALQVSQAHADAVAALNPNMQGPSALQIRLAKEAKSDAMKAIDSHTLTMQALITAWGIVGQANQTLAQKITGISGGYVRVSAAALTAGLGLTGDARKLAEERYAQAMAHRGMRPTGPAALGQPVGPTHGHGRHGQGGRGDTYNFYGGIHGVENIDHLMQQIERRTRVRNAQR